MARIVTLLPVILLLASGSCTDLPAEKRPVKPIIAETVIPVDTLVEPAEKPVEKIPETRVVVIDPSDIDQFLLNPFDLYRFKKKAGSPNSGGGNKHPFYFKPAYKGMYYAFFLFAKGGYLGTHKETAVFRENGLRITTYKRLNKYRYEYLDPTEELIDVEARLNNIHLPELAFVGLDTTVAKQQLGEPDFRKNGCFVYTHKDRALLLNLTGARINWLRYTRLKKPLSDDPVFDKLYTLNNTF